MMKEVRISCPHCRRQYTMKIDPERLQRLKTRATCGRCGKTFDVASRIAAASEAITEPKLPRYESPPPAAKLVPTPKASGNTPPVGTTVPDLRDEMEELAREFAEAAARFTPVGVKRPAGLSAEPPPTGPTSAEEPTTNPGVKPASLGAATDPALPIPAATDPDIPMVVVAAPATIVPAAAVPAVTVAPPAAATPALSLDAEPASEEEFAAPVPTRSRAPAPPKSWLELADPGLAALQSPPAAGAAALEALLHESDTIALPSPPAAS
jgi:hypothetical protein